LEYRVSLFQQIHEIVFHGKGGYDYNTIYNMPIWLRKFTFNKMVEFYEEENNQAKASNKGNNSKTLVDSTGKVNTPEFLAASKDHKPSYSTKASRK
jgi:hypothetical protein